MLALFGVGLVLLPALVQRSRVHPEPLINLELFRYRSFTSANIGVFLYGLAFTAGFLTNSLLLQDVWDVPIRDVGIALAPSPLLAAVVSPVTGRWADRVGHRWILGAGCASCGLGYLLYVLVLDEQSAVWSRFVPLGLLVGLGVGLTVATWSSAGIADIPQAKFGVAGATYNTLRQAAYGLGVSVVITLIAAGGEATTMRGIRWAYIWVSAAYFLAAVSVVLTFPGGSARDRAAAPVVTSRG